jgi:hypothetical protein
MCDGKMEINKEESFQEEQKRKKEKTVLKENSELYSRRGKEEKNRRTEKYLWVKS